MAKGKYEKWLSQEGLLLIESWAKNGLIDEQIASNMGITRSTLSEWKKRFSSISDALKKGKEVVDIQVENALFKRALGYEYKEIIKERIDDTGQKQRHKNGIEMTERQWETAKCFFGDRCCYCGKSGDLTKDHIKPLVKGGKMTMDNIIPCCRSCNSSKKDNDMMSWYQRQPFYDKVKAQRIHDYITFALDFLSSEDDNTSKLVVTKEITKHQPPDTTAQIFWLKNRRPDKWRDKQEIQNTNIVKPNEDWFEDESGK